MGFTGKQQSLPAHPPNLQNYNMSIYCVDLDDDDTNAKHWPCRKHLGNIMLTAKSRQSLVAPKEFQSSNLSTLAKTTTNGKNHDKRQKPLRTAETGEE